MATVTTESTPRSSEESLPPAGQPDQLDPQQVCVVDVEHEATGEVFRRDCYHTEGDLLEGDLAGIETVFHLVEGEVYVRAIDWARSSSLEPSVELCWVSTGMHVKDVDQIRVFTWPDAELLRVFKHMR